MYHNPVLAQEAIEALAIKRNGVYVDATFGGGGHSRLILKELGEDGVLHAFDQDDDALANLPKDEPRLVFNHHNFRYLKRFLRLHGVRKVDGILADLGVSSHQFDEAARGFSFRFAAPLDMRMNQQQERTAAQLVSTYSADELQSLFSVFGEVRNAKTLAQTIVEAREQSSIDTIQSFLSVIDPVVRGNRNRYLAQVFQALRIAVNDEMTALEDFLQNCLEVLDTGGRAVIISYHSLEDRMVKNFFKTGNAKGEVVKDEFGNIERPFKIITKKPILPTDDEILRNSRARSARMRVAQKI